LTLPSGTSFRSYPANRSGISCRMLTTRVAILPVDGEAPSARRRFSSGGVLANGKDHEALRR
jgi:hypothetical protein